VTKFDGVDDASSDDDNVNSSEDDSYALIRKIISNDDKKRDKERRKEGNECLTSDYVSDPEDDEKRSSNPESVIVQIAPSTSNDEKYSLSKRKNAVESNCIGGDSWLASVPTEESIEVVEPLRKLLRDASTTNGISQNERRKKVHGMKGVLVKKKQFL